MRDQKASQEWVARMIHNLLGSEAQEAPEALQNLLLSCVPKEMRQPLRQTKAFDSIKLWKLSADIARRDAAEKILKEYGVEAEPAQGRKSATP